MIFMCNGYLMVVIIGWFWVFIIVIIVVVIMLFLIGDLFCLFFWLSFVFGLGVGLIIFFF